MFLASIDYLVLLSIYMCIYDYFYSQCEQKPFIMFMFYYLYFVFEFNSGCITNV